MDGNINPGGLKAMLPRSKFQNTHSRGLHFSLIISKMSLVQRGFTLTLIILS